MDQMQELYKKWEEDQNKEQEQVMDPKLCNESRGRQKQRVIELSLKVELVYKGKSRQGWKLLGVNSFL